MSGEGTRTLHLAKWETRLWAWLIDIIIVGAVVNVLFEISGGPFFIVEPVFFGRNGVGLFVYWWLFDGYTGQSPGKMVLNLKVVDKAGDDIDLTAAAIEAFGKAFLLPLDCLIGWLAMPGRKLRLFNRLSDTIVIAVEPSDEVPEGVEYVIPEE